ncbi:hypothetical protein N9414_22878 [Nodularia spumigena CCY9414]|nr:hypothetical protein N9414_22878 [Nodularia spumigena CCY9414]
MNVSAAFNIWGLMYLAPASSNSKPMRANLAATYLRISSSAGKQAIILSAVAVTCSS